jgi:CheY-like chemotaxis protein
MRETMGPRWRGDKSRRQTRKSRMRILVADEDSARRRLMAALIVNNLAPAITFEARDVPTALEALLTRHPDFVFADLCLPGHTQGGLRLILDAASLGVPAVVTSDSMTGSLELRLEELGIGWVPKGASESALFAVIRRALANRRRPRVDSLLPVAEPSRPRMHTA